MKRFLLLLLVLIVVAGVWFEMREDVPGTISVVKAEAALGVDTCCGRPPLSSECPAPESLSALLPDLPKLSVYTQYNPERQVVVIDSRKLVFNRTYTEIVCGRLVWHGRTEQESLASYVSVSDDTGNYFAIIGLIQGSYAIHVRDGLVKTYENRDPVACPKELPAGPAKASMLGETGRDIASLHSALASGSAPHVIDLAIFCDYKTFLVENKDIERLLTKVIAQIATSNEEMANSLISTFRWKLAYLAVVPPETYVFRNDMPSDVGKLWSDTDPLGRFINDAMLLTGCDQAHLLVTGAGSWGGMASMGGRHGMTRYDQLFFRTLTHEMGHNLGLAHDRQTDGAVGQYPERYNFGFQKEDAAYYYWMDKPAMTGDIMSYSGHRLPYFSNPEITYSYSSNVSGYGAKSVSFKMGVEVGEPDAAHAARYASENGERMATYGAKVNHPILDPLDLSLESGKSDKMVVWVEDVDARFQWYFKDQPITGETQRSLSLENVTAEKAGGYYCKITTRGEVLTSRTAILTVIGAKQAQAPFSLNVSATTIEYPQYVTLTPQGGSGTGEVMLTDVSGSGTFNGNYFWPSSTGVMTLRATKLGDEIYSDATADVTITVLPGRAWLFGTLLYPENSYINTTITPLSVPTAVGGMMSFSSSDTAIATVDSVGVVTPKAPGAVTITATLVPNAYYAADVAAASVLINIKDLIGPASFVGDLSYPEIILNHGFLPDSTPVYTNGTVSYSSSNPSVAGVTLQGIVQGYAVGTATISLRFTPAAGLSFTGADTISTVVTVKALGVASVAGTFVYPALVDASTIAPTQVPVATNGYLVFHTSDSSIAEISSSGVLTVKPNQAGKAITLTSTLFPNPGYTGTSIISKTVRIYPRDWSRLINLSTRSMVKDGFSNQVAGFIIEGTSSKRLLIRAGGPALARFGFADHLKNPLLTLFDSKGIPIGSNDDWDSNSISAVAKALDAYEWTAGSKDAAMLVTLAPGLYTAQVSDPDGNTGINLVEVYDADLDNFNCRLINISTRSLVNHDSEAQIVGFVVEGSSERGLLIRSGGPALIPLGVPTAILDPRMTVYNNLSVPIYENNNWNPKILAVAKAAGAYDFSEGSKDSAVLTKLAAGAYTAIVTPEEGVATGIGLIEVYEIDNSQINTANQTEQRAGAKP